MALSGAVREKALESPARDRKAWRSVESAAGNVPDGERGGRALRRRAPAWVAETADAVLFSYSQVLFTRSRPVGLLLMAATAVRPFWFLFGLGSVLLAAAAARLLGMDRSLVRDGYFGYNALLVGLAFPAYMTPAPAVVPLWALAIVTAVVVTAALTSMLGYTFNLPVLSLPFLLTLYATLAAAGHWAVPGLLHRSFVHDAPASLERLASLGAYLRCLGAIFFLPNCWSGFLVVCALGIFSRIGLALTVLGFLTGALVSSVLFAFPGDTVYSLIGFNFVLSAVALGGVWLVPGWRSLLVALCGVALCGPLAAACAGLLAPAGLPVLVLPFNLVLVLFLLALRRREAGAGPCMLDLPQESPEENLVTSRAFTKRFGNPLGVAVRLPFMGVWTCTQGVDGPHTHRGAWRHAWDFEREDLAGGNHRGGGGRPEDYLCFGEPVLAPAGGWVVRVVDGIPDNRVGEVNLEAPWGNCVILSHGPGLHTALCHLSPRTIRVKEGDAVQPGDALGRCGNSGRSLVPHLHVQFQASARVGAPTRDGCFQELIVESGEGPVYHPLLRPEEGARVSSVRPGWEIEGLLPRRVDEALCFRVARGSGAEEVEEVAWETDLQDQLALVSRSRKARLQVRAQPGSFCAVSFRGDRRSVLWALSLTLPRLPFHARPGIRWRDWIPRGRVLRWPRRALEDLLAPFRADGVLLAVDYVLRREGEEVVVEGRSAGLSPPIACGILLVPGRGIAEIRVEGEGIAGLRAWRCP